MTDHQHSQRELAIFELEQVIIRIQFRIDAMIERNGETVGLSGVFAAEIITACRRAIDVMEAEHAR